MWIGVDFDGTLAEKQEPFDPKSCGAPVEPMIERVKALLEEGREVRIFTARAWPFNRVFWPNVSVKDVLRQTKEEYAMVSRYGIFDMKSPEGQQLIDSHNGVVAIRRFCKKHLGQVLTITNVKEPMMEVLYDDRAIRVRENTGELAKKGK